MRNPSSRPLPVTAALALAARLLEGRGFVVVARNTRGDSLYLSPSPLSGAPGESPRTLRLSNHARTPKQRRGHPEVVASLVIRDPKTPDQLAAMVEAALRDYAGGLRRVPPDGTGSHSPRGA